MAAGAGPHPVVVMTFRYVLGGGNGGIFGKVGKPSCIRVMAAQKLDQIE